MAKKERQAKISYLYDRLWEQKLSQAYYLLVPESNDNYNANVPSLIEQLEETTYENSSHLYEGVLRSTEGE